MWTGGGAMFKKRCTLCGGRLSGNICTECGLDNSKNDEQYEDMLNKSICDGEPLTHIHEDPGNPSSYMSEEQLAERAKRAEQKAERSVNKPRKQNYTYSAAGKQKKKMKKNAWPVIFLVIVLVISVAPALFIGIKSAFLSNTYEVSEIWDASEDGRYENVLYDLSDDGETREEILYAGEYVVGVHIPEGTYTIKYPEMNGDCTLNVKDAANGIYMYKHLLSVDQMKAELEDVYEDVVNQITDMRLYRGAKLEISGDGYLNFYTDNAQPMEDGMDNPLTEEVRITEGQVMTAGTDFPAGVYDVLNSGEGLYLDFEVPNEPGEDFPTFYMGSVWMNNAGQEICYKNLVIPAGVKVSLQGYDTGENPGSVTLSPSERILSEDYEAYYLDE